MGKGIVHEDVGIDYPIKCTCPHNDTLYIEPDKIPFPNYTLAYEWQPIYRNLSLYPCELCAEVKKYNTASNSGSWLKYNKKKIKVCNITMEYRFTDVIKRRLIQGRLPPDKEYEYFASLDTPERNQNRGKASSPSKSNAPGLSSWILFSTSGPFNLRCIIGMYLICIVF